MQMIMIIVHSNNILCWVETETRTRRQLYAGFISLLILTVFTQILHKLDFPKNFLRHKQ